MRRRVIPVLLIDNGRLVKSVRFDKLTYVGDPINAVKIFNEKEVDEICILDISASKSKRGPDFEHISEIVSEAFMPLSYGGGVSSIEQASSLFYRGVEKVVLNTALHDNPNLITDIASQFGSQAVTASIDYAKNWFGKYKVFIRNGKHAIKTSPLEVALKAEDLGAGELLMNCIDRDGTYNGYDLDMLASIVSKVKIPVIACGGASDLNDFKRAMQAGASAVAAGSMFVFQRPNQAVLISYLNSSDIYNL